MTRLGGHGLPTGSDDPSAKAPGYFPFRPADLKDFPSFDAAAKASRPSLHDIATVVCMELNDPPAAAAIRAGVTERRPSNSEMTMKSNAPSVKYEAMNLPPAASIEPLGLLGPVLGRGDHSGQRLARIAALYDEDHGTPSFVTGPRPDAWRGPEPQHTRSGGASAGLWRSGTAGWARTNDLRIHNPPLYQLSYSCTFGGRNLESLAGRFKGTSASATPVNAKTARIAEAIRAVVMSRRKSAVRRP